MADPKANRDSAPSLDDLDAGWGDDEDEADIDAGWGDAEEVEEVEPEEADEPEPPGLTPEERAALAEAKAARAEARKERARAKAAAKKERRKARAQASAEKKKAKKKSVRKQRTAASVAPEETVRVPRAGKDDSAAAEKVVVNPEPVRRSAPKAAPKTAPKVAAAPKTAEPDQIAGLKESSRWLTFALVAVAALLLGGGVYLLLQK